MDSTEGRIPLQINTHIDPAHVPYIIRGTHNLRQHAYSRQRTDRGDFFNQKVRNLPTIALGTERSSLPHGENLLVARIQTNGTHG